MTTSIRHQYTAVLGVFLMIAGPATFSGCGGATDVAPVLSKLLLSVGTIAPGRFFTIEHPDIKAGSTVQVRFAGSNGYVFTFDAQNTENGRVRVAAPPVVDVQSGQFAAGDVTVSVVGLEGEAGLSIEALPDTQGAAPGSVLRAVFAAALDDHTSLLGKIATVSEQTSGGADASGVESAANDMVQKLQSIINEYDATGSLTIQDADGTTRPMTTAELELADRYLAAILLGIAEEMSGGISLPASARQARLLPAENGGSDQPDIVQQVNNALPAVRDGLRSGLAGGSTFMAGAGVAITIIGLWIEAPLIVFGGAICVVGGAVCSLANGALGGSNSDSFLNNDGDVFSSGQEAISQGIRYLSDVVSVVPGVPGLIATATGLATGIYDFFNNSRDIKCQEPQNAPNQRTIGIAAGTVQDFCDGEAASGGSGGSGGDIEQRLSGWSDTVYMHFGESEYWTYEFVKLYPNHTLSLETVSSFWRINGSWSSSGSTITMSITPTEQYRNYVFVGTVTEVDRHLRMEGTYSRETPVSEVVGWDDGKAIIEHRWVAQSGLWKVVVPWEEAPPIDSSYLFFP